MGEAERTIKAGFIKEVALKLRLEQYREVCLEDRCGENSIQNERTACSKV